MIKVSHLATPLLLATTIAAAANGAPQVPVWNYVGALASDDDTQLRGVTAIAADSVWAVGQSGSKALTALWDGTRFNAVKSAKTGKGSAVLEDVAGTAPNDVWAVGHVDSTGETTFTEHWDGKTWSRIPSPNLGVAGDHNDLTGVVAVAPNDAWSFGYHRDSNGSVLTATILHWDGAAWSVVKNSCGASMSDGFALAANDVWAVGDNQSCHWDGRGWTAQDMDPGPRAGHAYMSDIHGVSSTDIWSVGSMLYNCGQDDPCETGAIEHWDGKGWHYVASDVFLRGVHALAKNNVVAAGTDGGPAVLHFNGQTWSMATLPAQPVHGQFFAIDALSAKNLFAVGDSEDAFPSDALAAHATP